ncbi:MAG: SusD/RagB family nutrient-binding outer membrane lipoprotein [Bacteroidales bacterium]|nr:SusD/RagB family nutrient-binding outer membrane lipoprotein [Bacteroidales bacterium]
MKYIKSILMAFVCVLALASCSEWLDVNTDPENPSSESALFQNRLAHIEFYTNSATQFAAWRSSMSMGDWTRSPQNGGNYYHMSYWYPLGGITTTAYQWWFVGAACNIEDMYKKAYEAEAWHYCGVAKVIRAYGFMLMTDLHGEMPYTDALSENATPVYDNGKTIYLGVLKELDEGLEFLSRSQAANVPALSLGDYWGGGDVQKWIRFGNLLKARYCAKLNKKQTGSYLEGKYDTATILEALNNGPQSIADDMVIRHTDDNGPTHDVLGWDEPVDYSPIFSVCGMNAGYMVTEMLVNNLTNFGGYGVEDPRADKVIPWAYDTFTDKSSTPAGVKWNGNWRRSLGVDMTSENSPLMSSGPRRADWDAEKGWFTPSPYTETRPGDIFYVECTSDCKGYFANPSIMYYRRGKPECAESGSFYSRVSSPSYLGTYAEACFIKAEILFNQGDKTGAFTAYKNGIKASMDEMNVTLRKWVAEDASLANCPSFTPMTDAQIDNFLNTGIGTAADLTLGKILTQKRLALHYSVEIWNDMRRYDFDENLFLGWKIPAYHNKVAAAVQAIPAGKQFRRWQQCSHEYNYNKVNLQAIASEVPGAKVDSDMWNTEPDSWTINVWWDSNQQ